MGKGVGASPAEPQQHGLLMMVIKILISVLQANNIQVPEEALALVGQCDEAKAKTPSASSPKRANLVSPTQPFAPKEVP